MTHISGWCNGPDGCNSEGAHHTCGERIRKGLLARCDCTVYDTHPKPESLSTVGLSTPGSVGSLRYDKSNETAPGGVGSTVDPGASPTNEESTSA